MDSATHLTQNEEDNVTRENNILHKISSSFKSINVQNQLRRRLPVIEWLPKYSIALFLQDFLAGCTVGLTEIPQGIAYAVVAGLSPEYGLYSGFMGCFMYFLFGSCKDLNVGPTAIMALMVNPYVKSMGPDMAVLLTFTSGCIIFLLGLFQLGFIVEFFSYPVIAGFTSAAAFNIASSQLKGFFGITFTADKTLDIIIETFKNLKNAYYPDYILGLVSLLLLIVMKEMRRFGTFKFRDDWSRTKNIFGVTLFFGSVARNALVVIAGSLFAYFMEIYYGETVVHVTKDVNGGLPPFKPPPFSTDFNGTHYTFKDMANKFETTLVFAPLVAMLEHVAISKAFSKGRSLDATQEMFALGICNIMGSFVRSMPVTGSFTRTAVNNASGVKTTFGGLITASMVLMALSFLTEYFYYIPKATLAAVVIGAMIYLFDYEAFWILWRTKKLDFCVLLVTVVTCLLWTLEYGILVGVGFNLFFILYASARPKIPITTSNQNNVDMFIIEPKNALQFPAAEFLREKIIAECYTPESIIIFNGKYIHYMDATVAKSLSVLVDEVKVRKQKVFFLNFKHNIRDTLIGVNSNLVDLFRNDDITTISKEENSRQINLETISSNL